MGGRPATFTWLGFEWEIEMTPIATGRCRNLRGGDQSHIAIVAIRSALLRIVYSTVVQLWGSTCPNAY